MSIRILSSSDVEAITSSIEPVEVMDMMSEVFLALSATPDRISSPLRSTIEMSRHTTLFMPARVGPAPLAKLGETAIKIVSIPRSGVEGGLPATTIIMDEQTGCASAVVNASSLTALRTAAGSLLATTLLYKNTDPPRNIVCFGAGLQIFYHASLILKHYSSSATTCTIVNRSDNERLRNLVHNLKLKFPNTIFQTFVRPPPPETCTDPDNENEAVQKAVQEAHIICTATSSNKPLFPSSWVSRGTHLNLVGSYTEKMREVDNDIVSRAKTVIVDSREACELEAGELMGAQRQKTPFDILELGQAIRNMRESKSIWTNLENQGDITVFKSVGLGIQDVAIGTYTLRKAERLDYGLVVPF